MKVGFIMINIYMGSRIDNQNVQLCLESNGIAREEFLSFYRRNVSYDGFGFLRCILKSATYGRRYSPVPVLIF